MYCIFLWREGLAGFAVFEFSSENLNIALLNYIA